MPRPAAGRRETRGGRPRFGGHPPAVFRGGPGLLRSILPLALMALCLAGPAPARAGEASARVVDLPRAEGGPLRLLAELPPAPRAVLILLPGGSGVVGIGADGRVRHGANVLIRIRADLVARGFGVILPDAAPPGLRGQRASAAYARTVNAIIAHARAAAARPVFLMGTSQGAIAAVAAAAHRPAKGPTNGPADGPANGLAGIILSEPVTRAGRSPETVFDAHPHDVRVPVLVVTNAEDGCHVAPPQDVGRLVDSLAQAPSVAVVRLSGGVRRGRPCGSRSPHGYLGIEPQFVAAVSHWLDAQLAAPAARP